MYVYGKLKYTLTLFFVLYLKIFVSNDKVYIYINFKCNVTVKIMIN